MTIVTIVTEDEDEDKDEVKDKDKTGEGRRGSTPPVEMEETAVTKKKSLSKKDRKKKTRWVLLFPGD